MFWFPLYFSVIFFSFASYFYPKIQKLSLGFCLLFSFIYLWMGYLNGVDWVNYYAVYQSNDTLTEFASNYEIGFSLFLYFTKFIGFDFLYAILIFYLFALFIIYKGILKTSKILPINYCFLFASMLFFNGLELFNDQLRQLAAFALAIHALFYIINNEVKKFVIFGAMAVLFHYSAIIIILIYPIINFKKKNVIIIGSFITLSFTFLILNTSMVINLFNSVGLGLLASRLNNYIGKFEPTFGSMMLFDTVIIVFYIYYRFSSNVEQKIWNGIFISSCLHLVFYLFPILQRFNAYLYLFLCILSAHYFCVITMRPSIQKLIFGIISIPLFLSVMMRFYTDPIRQYTSAGYINSITVNERMLEIQRDIRCANISDVAETFCRK